jgi:hypothetical protein
MTSVLDHLAHYGVKGMKWGVTRRSDGSPQEVSVTQPTPGKRLKTSGGRNLPASPDAIAAAAARQKARRSTTNALSNQELQQVVNRMNLEQQYARLAAPQKSTGQKFAEAFLGDLAKAKAGAKLDDLAKEDPNMAPIAQAFKSAANKGGGKKKK